jgi:hypothetical protein
LRRSRNLVWDGCVNVRDLGGHPTEGGRETHYGRIVRADTIRTLSEEGRRALVDYGIRTVVDLRTLRELEEDAPAAVRHGTVEEFLRGGGAPDDIGERVRARLVR